MRAALCFLLWTTYLLLAASEVKFLDRRERRGRAEPPSVQSRSGAGLCANVSPTRCTTKHWAASFIKLQTQTKEQK
ncbi:unnamed protein product [Tetraodon nigroviridis]|uniref:Chromosome 3 SCAF15037, whole genome shotgun sequence n=1 Tax=Tetraodon nigroviridis TaxID=99883 RepID=Q4RJM8_TETNG|nr:unnamed protein product [Tetraodon nigroviridis]